MKKGQIEGMGLVIIVMLVTIGLLFSLSHQEQKDPKLNTYTDDKLATSFLAAMLEAKSECGPNLAALASDCVKETRGRPTRNNCEEPACEHIEPILTDLANKTFTHQGYDYELTLTYTYGQDKKELLTIGEGCDARQRQAAKGYYDLVIHPTPGKAIMTFTLCT